MQDWPRVSYDFITISRWHSNFHARTVIIFVKLFKIVHISILYLSSKNGNANCEVTYHRVRFINSLTINAFTMLFLDRVISLISLLTIVSSHKHSLFLLLHHEQTFAASFYHANNLQFRFNSKEIEFTMEVYIVKSQGL